MRTIIIAATLLASAGAWAAPPEVSFNGTQPVSAKNLSDEDGCFPTRLAGRVVKRAFDKNEIMLTSVTIEQPSGERLLINVDGDKIERSDMASRSNAIRALQILLREGSRVNLGAFACGAAGRVLMLDSVRR